MSILIQYLLKFSISLSVLYLFYQLVLRRLTFYTWNRWYLLGYSILCFIIPFVNISWIMEREEFQHSKFINLIPLVGQMTENKAPINAANNRVDIQFIYFIVLVGGAAIIAGRLLLQYFSLQRLRKQGIIIHNEKVTLIHIDKNILPFSFGNTIYLNKYLHTDEELKEIIHHEFIHVRQQHSLDILWSEWLCIINWFNPFAWLLRKAIRQNLEFIADHKVLENGVNKKQYQYLLLKVTGASQFSIANNFNFSSLKNRIAMMNSVKSARLHLVKFLFLAPLLIVLLLSFRQSQSRQSQHKTAVAAVQVKDTLPPPPPPPPVPHVRIDKTITKTATASKTATLSEVNINGDTLVAPVVTVSISALAPVKPITTLSDKTETITAVKSKVETITSVHADVLAAPTIAMIGESEGETVLSIKNSTTKEQLEQLKKDLENKGFTLNIKDASYDEGELISLKAEIHKGDAWGKFEIDHFQKFRIMYVTDKNPRFICGVEHGRVVFTNSAE